MGVEYLPLYTKAKYEELEEVSTYDETTPRN